MSKNYSEHNEEVIENIETQEDHSYLEPENDEIETGGEQSKSPIQKGKERLQEHIGKRNSSERVGGFRDNLRDLRDKAVFVLQRIVEFLSNPIVWVLTLVALLGLAIYSALQTTGQNEAIEGCFGVGEMSSVSFVEGNPEENARMVMNWLMSTPFEILDGKPMTKEQAAGVLGNMSVESQFNPKAEYPSKVAEYATNADMKAGGTSAIGLFQWTQGRRAALADFADSRGGLWSDPTIQLEYFKTELDGSEGAMIMSLAPEFKSQGKSAAEYAELFDKGFERSGGQGLDARKARAEGYNSNFGTSSSSSTGCIGRYNNSSIVEMAKSISWRSIDEATVSPSDVRGGSVVHPGYKAAKDAIHLVDPDPRGDGYYADCARFVVTVIKSTVDPDFPWAHSGDLPRELKSRGWVEYTNPAERQPGDVWVTIGQGHALIYVGEVDGKADQIAQASYLEQVAYITDGSVFLTNFTDWSGRKYKGYRYAGG